MIKFFFAIIFLCNCSISISQDIKPDSIFFGNWISRDSIGFEISGCCLTSLEKIKNNWEKTFQSKEKNNLQYFDTAIINSPKKFKCFAITDQLVEGKYLLYNDGRMDYKYKSKTTLYICEITLLQKDKIKLKILKLREIETYNGVKEMILTPEQKFIYQRQQIENCTSIILERK